MRKVNWKDVAELIGITAIVASLLFVGLQLKQSQEIAVAAQYQDRAANLNEMSAAALQSERTLRLRGENLKSISWGQSIPADVQASFDSQAPEDLGARWYEFVSVSAIAENNQFQYQAGFLDEDSWRAIQFRLRYIFSDPHNRNFYRIGKPGFSAEFQSLVDEIILEIESDTQ